MKAHELIAMLQQAPNAEIAINANSLQRDLDVAKNREATLAYRQALADASNEHRLVYECDMNREEIRIRPLKDGEIVTAENVL